MEFVDLHSHVLPGLDDGAACLEDSMTLLRGLADLGFTRVYATPHQREGLFLPDAEAIGEALALVREALSTSDLTLSLGLGAENMWDQTFFQRFVEETIPCYDRGPAFLVEIPTDEIPSNFEGLLFKKRVGGLLPVLAHPERYEPLWGQLDVAKQLATQCVFVVDLGAVGGHHGRGRAKAARALLQEGIAQAAASDVHRAQDIEAARDGMSWIERKLGTAALAVLLKENPERILRGEHPGTP